MGFGLIAAAVLICLIGLITFSMKKRALNKMLIEKYGVPKEYDSRYDASGR